MSEKPIHIEVSMGDGSDQVMFTLIYSDGYRTAYWLPFWRACWEAMRLIWRGVDVAYSEPKA